MNILIIEDDILLASQIARTFYRRVMTYRIDTVTSIRAYDQYKDMLQIYDIVLVDLILGPYSSSRHYGYTIIEAIHQSIPTMPIIVISGVDDIESLRRAFDLGAIDYVTKPFRLSELEVRVDHWFSRFYIDTIDQYTRMSMGDLRYEIREHEFYKGEEKLPLSRMSKYLLSLFLKQRGSLLSHTFLREKVWGDRDITCERNIRVAILRLRRSLEPYALDRWIRTLPGEGYIFSPH